MHGEDGNEGTYASVLYKQKYNIFFMSAYGMQVVLPVNCLRHWVSNLGAAR